MNIDQITIKRHFLKVYITNYKKFVDKHNFSRVEIQL